MKKIFPLGLIVFFFISCTGPQPSREIIRLSDTANNASCVFLTSDEAGNPAVSWTEIDSGGGKHFYFSLWNVKEKKFADKINIPMPQNTSIHEEGMPKIAFKGNGAIIATFETSLPVPGTKWGKGDIEYSLSADKGKTWTKPTSVQASYPFEGSIGFSNTLRLDNGEIGIVWLGSNPRPVAGRPVMFAKTTSKGGFDKGVLVDSVACECCRIALSADGNGDIKLAFRNLLPGSVRDISIARSDDYGQTFTRPVSFSDDQWVIDGCPHAGPAVVSNNQKAFAAWYAGSSAHENAGIYYAELDKKDNTITKRMIASDGKFIQLCLMPGGERIVGYNETYRSGDSIYNKIVIGKINETGYFSKEVTLPRSHGFYPVVASAGNDHAVIAWKDEGRVFYRIVATSKITNKLAGADFKLPALKNIISRR